MCQNSSSKFEAIEGCARQGTAHRGRAAVQMVSRHFDLDRVRGSLITSHHSQFKECLENFFPTNSALFVIFGTSD